MIKQNEFKIALAENRLQYGLWCSLASNIITEVLAGSGHEWLTIDTEHSPYDLFSVLAQLQAIAPYATEPLVRLPNTDTTLIKQFLDIGARSLIFPNMKPRNKPLQSFRPPAIRRAALAALRASSEATAMGAWRDTSRMLKRTSA